MKFLTDYYMGLIIALAAIGGLAFLTIDYHNVTSQESPQKAEWQPLETQLTRATLQEKNKLQKLNIWNMENSDIKNQLSEKIISAWTMKAIIFEARQPYILVLAEGESALQSFRVGDTLPGGELLLEISGNEIKVRPIAPEEGDSQPNQTSPDSPTEESSRVIKLHPTNSDNELKHAKQ